MEQITGQIYTNHMVPLLVKYIRGNRYVMVLYNYDSNEILTWAMKKLNQRSNDRKNKEMHGMLVSQGLLPHIKRLYNGVSKLLLDLMEMIILISNWYQHKHISGNRQNKRLGPGKIFFGTDSVALINFLQSIFWID